MYWCDRILGKARDQILREFGWDGTHPVEMEVDQQTFLHE
jgi:hypothetical protein